MNQPSSTQPSSRVAGLTLLELLVTVTVVAILAAGVVPLIHGVPNKTAQAKLVGDVASINQAIQVYRAHGGSLDSVTDAEEVITKLKTRADAKSAEEIAGLTGSVLDRRVDAVMQSNSEAISDQLRAVWIPERQHFKVATSGARGIKVFRYDERLAALPITEEARAVSMKLATEDRWIWDYEDPAANGRKGPTEVTTTSPVPTTPAPPVTPNPNPNPNPNRQPGSKLLKAPVISIPSGKFPITQFALPVYLYNTNPAGASRVLYAVNGGGWRVYDGTAIQASPGYEVIAFAEAIDPTWKNSKQAKESYKATPVELDPPIINSSAPQFDFDENKIVEVTLENPNKPDVSEMQYRVSGTTWEVYTGSFRMHVDDNPIGAVIEARAIPLKEYYLESDISYLNIKKPTPWFSISGNSDGIFSDPYGSESLASNLMNGVTSEFFTWGVPSGTEDPSSLLFTGAEFFDVSPGERFLVGVLDYYNGTIQSGSGAESVDFAIGLAFNDSVTEAFEFTLDLINSRNNTGTQEGDADFVFLSNLASNSTTTIGEDLYHLILEFGETTEDGFSTMDQFHVFEDATASGNLYARLELVQ